MDLNPLDPPAVDLGAWPRDEPLPRRVQGWLLAVGSGVLFVVTMATLWRGSREGLFPGLIALAMFGVGVAEVSGARSRWRWRRAKRQVAARSTPSAVGWRYEAAHVMVGALALVGGSFCAFLLALNETLGPVFGAALALLVFLPILHVMLALLVNTRRITLEGDKVTCSSGPVPLGRPRHLADALNARKLAARAYPSEP